jgi:PPM family protein phosphatase
MSGTHRDVETTLDLPNKAQSAQQGRALAVRSFGRTDRGSVRETNEDQFLIAELAKLLEIQQCSLPQTRKILSGERGHIFLVADGLGGAPAGEAASALAVESIEGFLLNTLKWFFHLKGPEKESLLTEFQAALTQADARILQEVEENPDLDGMGTTLTLAYSHETSLFVVNAGDSRCYLFRGGDLIQLTRDQTLAQEMALHGMRPSGRLNRFSHILTNAIGGRTPGVEAQVHKAVLEPDDVLLLATDGLTRDLSDEQIAEILALESDPKIACDLLIARALEAGGRDNVTVIVTRFEATAA